MRKEIYSEYGLILVISENYINDDGAMYSLYLDGEFISDYQTKTPCNLKKFEYEIIDFFTSIVKY